MLAESRPALALFVILHTATKQLLSPTFELRLWHSGSHTCCLHTSRLSDAGKFQEMDAMQSLVAQVDLASGEVVRKIESVGVNSHGLVAWRGRFVMLSSKETRLVTMEPDAPAHARVTTIWQARLCACCLACHLCVPCHSALARRCMRPCSNAVSARDYICTLGVCFGCLCTTAQWRRSMHSVASNLAPSKFTPLATLAHQKTAA